MKKNFLWFLGGLAVASAILICFGLRLIHLSKPAEEEIVKHSKEQMDKTMTKVEGFYNDNAVEIKEMSFAMLSSTCDSITNDLDTLHAHANNIIEATQGILFARQESAKKSYEEAVKIKSQNLELAQIYILNAINHDPSNITYLTEYYSMIKNNSDASYDEIENVSSLLSSCVYQVDYENIATMNGWIDELSKRQEEILATNTNKDEAAEVAEIKARYDKLIGTQLKVTTTAKASDVDVSSLLRAQEEMAGFIGDVSEDHRFEEYYKNIVDRYEKVSKTINYIELAKQCENLLAQTSDAIGKSKDDLATEYLSLIETVFYQMSGTNDIQNILPQNNWLSVYAEQKEKYIKSINKSISQNAFDKIKQIVAQGTSVVVTGKYQAAINTVQEKYLDASSYLTKIIDEEVYSAAQLEMNKLSNKIAELQEQQQQEYQKWAAGVVLALEQYIDNDSGRLRENDAMSYFTQYPTNVTNIDQRCLVPEVSSVLQQLTDKLFEKVKEKDLQREFNRKFMFAKKRSLEEF